MTLGKSIRILSICDDDCLGYSRELLLKIAGYEVESQPTDIYLDESLAKSFDVAILCHSVGAEAADHLARVLRNLNSDIRIIGVSQYFSKLPDDYDGGCTVEDGPEGLLRSIETVLGHRKSEVISP